MVEKDIKWQIFDFQKRCLENMDKLMPLMQELTSKRLFIQQGWRDRTGFQTHDPRIPICILAMGKQHQ
ncbi:MAG: hypothetical protein ACLU4N_03030 [Butyricimonas faecihominis]